MPKQKLRIKQLKKSKGATEFKSSKDRNEDDGAMYNALLEQINKEYELTKRHTSGRIEKNLKRLKLYNNQTRSEEHVGDPLLFTMMDTFIAAHFNDIPVVKFVGRSEGDDDVAENLNAMAKYDYDAMELDKLRYFWIWDTAFFGKGYVLVWEFDKNGGMSMPVPRLLDPMTMLIDPLATTINGGIAKEGAARFLGWEATMTKRELKLLENDGVLFDVDLLKPSKDNKGLMANARSQRAIAQGLEDDTMVTTNDLGDNTEYHILNWFTHFEGKKVLVTSGNDRKALIRYDVIYDPEDEKVGLGTDDWPVVERDLFPVGHEFYGVSFPDLVEDKQRRKAVLLNLGIQLAESDLYGGYIYDLNKIRNRSDLNFGMNKHIGVVGDPRSAVVPRVTKSANLTQLSMMMEQLDTAAQRATATPEMQQGVISTQQRTASELNLVASRVDTRYSKTAKVFAWAEKRFWRHWYLLYKRYMAKDIDKKVIRLRGVSSDKVRELTKDNIITDVDPDIRVESTAVNKAEQEQKLQQIVGIATIASKLPEVNMRYIVRKMAEWVGLTPDEVDQFIKPSLDELRAKDENTRLNDNELVEISPNDDHSTHIHIHSAANDTDAAFAHIEAHKQAQLLKRDRPELFKGQPTEEGQGLGAKDRVEAPNMGTGNTRPDVISQKL